MSKIKINTDKVEGSCVQIERIAIEYNKVIEDIFNRIKYLQKDGVWIGQDNTSAVYKFIIYSMREKAIYSDYILQVLSLTNKIKTYAKDIKRISDYKI